MFCDACGNALQTGQGFCNRCGKEVTGGQAVSYPNPSRVQQHVRLAGILWLAHSALEAIGGVALFIIANSLFAQRDGGPPHFLQPLLSIVAIFLAVKAAAGFLAGWGLLQREPWARMLALVLSFLVLFHVPFGTALGVYTLWILLPAESEQEYARQAQRLAAA